MSRDLSSGMEAQKGQPGIYKGTANCALHYVPEAYHGDGPLVVGRQSAGSGFLDALIKYSDLDTLYCIAETDEAYTDFVARTKEIGTRDLSTICIRPREYDRLSEAGCIFHPGPIISESAWWRRFCGERSFSICGITHSVATERVIRSVRDFVVAPTQPWDALICTSVSARSAILRVRETWKEYLASRNIHVGESPVQLPVIPLGVHQDRFERTEASVSNGQELRKKLGISPDDVVVLYFGRFDFRSKSHPVSLFRAMHLASLQSPGVNLVLLMVGQVADPINASEFQMLSRLCPSVQVHWVDGADNELSQASWFASDIFISLPDNVQESFGLTPVEAMAASLPCVVSDWNGYRETVVDRETGFLVPTMTAPPGAGIEMADRHGQHLYDHFILIGLTAQCTAVDIDKCGQAIATLAQNPELRKEMGEAGRRRAETVYGWRNVIRQYQDLWTELAELREKSEGLGIRNPLTETVHPDFPDLFSMFRDHPSRQLSDDDVIEVSDMDARYVLTWLKGTASYSFAEEVTLEETDLTKLLLQVEAKPQTVGALCEGFGPEKRYPLLRTLMWLYKVGLITVRHHIR